MPSATALFSINLSFSPLTLPLLMVLVEEALRSRVPTILIDVKGDLPNLLLAFPSFDACHFTHWVDGHGAPDELSSWKIDADHLAQFRSQTELRVLAPGSSAGERLHILSSLERRSQGWTGHRDAGPRRPERRHLAGAALARQGPGSSTCANGSRPRTGAPPPSSSASLTSTTRSARSCSGCCSKSCSPIRAPCPARAASRPCSSLTKSTAFLRGPMTLGDVRRAAGGRR